MINDEIIPELRRIYGDQFGRRIWWFQDGAPAHRPLIVRERLHELFGDHIVALNYDIEWPARSPKTTRSRAQLCLRRNGGHVEGNGT